MKIRVIDRNTILTAFLAPLFLLLVTGCGTMMQFQDKVEEQRVRREREAWVKKCHGGAKYFYSKQGAWNFCRCSYYEWSEGEAGPIEAGINCMDKFQ